MARNTVARSLHDIGLAAWFGGTLMGAIGVNGAAADVDDPRQRARVANAGWARWTPVNLAAIGIHLAGGALLLKDNRHRVAGQKGVSANTVVKAGLTAAALAATGYSRMLGQKIQHAGDVPVEGGTSPHPSTPPEVASAQQQLAALQWLIPALTGAVVASNALHGEQQRPSEVLVGTAKRMATQVGSAVGGAVSAAARNPQATFESAKASAKGLARVA